MSAAISMLLPLEPQNGSSSGDSLEGEATSEFDAALAAELAPVPSETTPTMPLGSSAISEAELLPQEIADSATESVALPAQAKPGDRVEDLAKATVADPNAITIVADRNAIATGSTAGLPGHRAPAAVTAQAQTGDGNASPIAASQTLPAQGSRHEAAQTVERPEDLPDGPGVTAQKANPSEPANAVGIQAPGVPVERSPADTRSAPRANTVPSLRGATAQFNETRDVSDATGARELTGFDLGKASHELRTTALPDPTPATVAVPPSQPSLLPIQPLPQGLTSPLGETGATTPGSASPIPAEALPLQIEWLAQRGGGRARVQLHPAHLGQIELEVRMRGGVVEVVLNVQEAAAHLPLQAQRLPLANALSAHNLELSHFEVTDQEAGRRDAEDRKPSGEQFTDAQSARVPDRASVPTLTTPTPNRSPSSGIDVRI